VQKPIQNVNQNQKAKGGVIPSQRNIKINLTKIIKDVRIKKNNKILGRKSLSIKKISKENNSDFSLSQLNDKMNKKNIKNEDGGNDIDIGNILPKIKPNINKTLQEEIKGNALSKNAPPDEPNSIGVLIDTNYISNVKNRINNSNTNNNTNTNTNRTTSIPTNLIKGLNQDKINNKNHGTNYYRINYNYNYNYNYNANLSTNTNYNLNNKNDYSVDNATELSNNNIINTKNKENTNDININTNNETEPVANTKNLNPKFEKKNENSLFDEENLAELPPDYDENFNDLYSVINKMNFGNVLVGPESLFTPEGRVYKKFREGHDKLFEQLFQKKRTGYYSNNKPKKLKEGISMTSNTKTNSSSSKKDIVNPMYNDLNIVKDLNIY